MKIKIDPSPIYQPVKPESYFESVPSKRINPIFGFIKIFLIVSSLLGIIYVLSISGIKIDPTDIIESMFYQLRYSYNYF